ncbi:hypothetical protein CB0940_03062 [Cercospora beticola]|uniref:Uncharacterized protein n=1 Tax=Cercospora beticola TaxID=122368 RepID=A0A2G5I2G9_CERBT|nr:hypothetical protein CB0940_03062 [Cercospora beticola]PIA99004.1 hypothetical protein CB0940_03062 [Cercospora beticola]
MAPAADHGIPQRPHPPVQDPWEILSSHHRCSPGCRATLANMVCAFIGLESSPLSEECNLYTTKNTINEQHNCGFLRHQRGKPKPRGCGGNNVGSGMRPTRIVKQCHAAFEDPIWRIFTRMLPISILHNLPSTLC